MNNNIKNALNLLQVIRNKYPNLNKTELAIMLTGSHDSELYKMIALLLNEVE